MLNVHHQRMLNSFQIEHFRSDLLESVENVRKQRDTLNGLTLDEITKEADRYIIAKQKECNRNFLLFQFVRNVLFNECNGYRFVWVYRRGGENCLHLEG